MDGWIETMSARKVVVADPTLSAVRFNVVRGILPSPPPPSLYVVFRVPVENI